MPSDFLQAAQAALTPAVSTPQVTAPLHILWQDDDMVVVYKPAGWLVHRTGLDAHETRFVMQTLRDQLGRHVFPVHRLDKGTCGLLIMALHKDAARALTEAFTCHAVQKRYLALVRGWLPEQVVVDHALQPDDAPKDAPAQPAHTRLHCLARLNWPESYDPRHAGTRISLVQAQPSTGRRHQIRRHLKHVAHPIIGDATHGKGPLNRWWAERLGQQRLWLHAQELSLPHPMNGQILNFVADWQTLAHLPEVQSWRRLLTLPGWMACDGKPLTTLISTELEPPTPASKPQVGG